jgi:hypothetical protein
MIQGDSFSRINKDNGLINKSKKKGKGKNNKNIKTSFMQTKPINSTE